MWNILRLTSAKFEEKVYRKIAVLQSMVRAFSLVLQTQFYVIWNPSISKHCSSNLLWTLPWIETIANFFLLVSFSCNLFVPFQFHVRFQTTSIAIPRIVDHLTLVGVVNFHLLLNLANNMHGWNILFVAILSRLLMSQEKKIAAMISSARVLSWQIKHCLKSFHFRFE